MDMNETAGQLYESRRKETLRQLDKIRRIICEKSDADQARTPNSYEHAGDLGHVNAELAELITFSS